MNCVGCNSESLFHFMNNEHQPYYKCSNCNTVQLNEYLDEATVYEYYNKSNLSGSYNIANSSKDSNRLKFLNLLSYYDSHLTSLSSKERPLRLLDIGCFNGDFLSLVNHKYPNIETFGFEIMASRFEYGAKQKVWGGKLSDNPFGEDFDIVVMNDVIEHLSDHENDFKFISKATKKEALIFITTPNATSFFSKILSKRWGVYDGIEHSVIFSEKGIKVFLQRHGFSLVTLVPYYKSLNLHYILKMILKWQFKINNNLLFLRFMKYFTLRLYFGEMIIVAKKNG